MNKFHQIPTDKFVPISHDNSYLFNHYDKVANFLAINLNKDYKTYLAKPIQNGYFFDWLSVHENLKNINEIDKTISEIALLKYWEFIELINLKINLLSKSSDANNLNWASLLTKVFDVNNNFIFSNGKDISIVWGWKFENSENYKPSFPKKPIHDVELPETNYKEIIDTEVPGSTAEIPFDPAMEDVNEFIEKDESIKNESKKLLESKSFLSFLKWFASTYWWLLWLLTFLAATIFFIKIVTLRFY